MKTILNLLGLKKEDRSGNETSVIWKPLVSKEVLAEIDTLSSERPQYIFKHSTTCGISRMVLTRFEKRLSQDTPEADLYLLDLWRHREVSNAVSSRYGVRHESPQLLVIKEGEAVTFASHGAINAIDLE